MGIPAAKQYILDFEQLGMGMFVHWGLYSQRGQGEWIYFYENLVGRMEMPEYKKLFDTFTADTFDAEELVLTAKKGGCRYIVLTTRHHEGFSLYDTCGLTDYDAPHSPAKRDLVREFVDACNKYDVVPFFYHTTIDWSRDDYLHDFDSYLEFLRKSVEILCKNYGKIGGLWFDGNWELPDADWKEDELYATIRKYQPEAMIINNTGKDFRGKVGHREIDAVTFEEGHVTPMNREGMEKYISAEVCITLNNRWGVSYHDIDYKSPAEVLKTLCESRRAGANFLLNIGPEAGGNVEPFQKAFLGLIGRWMDIFGEAIYNGRPCGIAGVGDNFGLKSADGEYIYLFAFNIGFIDHIHRMVNGKYVGGYSYGNVEDKIESIVWLDEQDKELDFMQKNGILSVNLTGYPYEKRYPVRVAKAKIAK